MARIAVDARHLSEEQSGGYQTYVSGLVSGLSRQRCGHDLWLLTSTRQKRVDGFNAVTLREGVRALGPCWREQVKIPRVSRQFSLDLVHHPCNTMPWRSGAPAIVTMHDLLALRDSRHLPGWYQRSIREYERFGVRAAMRDASVLITPSDASAAEILSAGFPPQRLRVIANGLDGRFFLRGSRAEIEDFRQRTGLREPYLLALASADPRKNVETAIEAFARIGGRLPELRLAVVVSAAGLQPRLLAKAVELGVEKSVIFVGRLLAADMPLAYAGAEAMLFLSQEEGFGMPPVECMAAGTPVICSAVPPMDVHQDAALTVDIRNLAAVGEAIIDLCCKPEIRRRVIETGRSRAAQYSWDQTAAETLLAYDAAIEAGPRRRSVTCG